MVANGHRVPNEGEQDLDVMTEEGAMSDMVLQLTDVNKPLFSITKLADRWGQDHLRERRWSHPQSSLRQAHSIPAEGRRVHDRPVGKAEERTAEVK